MNRQKTDTVKTQLPKETHRNKLTTTAVETDMQTQNDVQTNTKIRPLLTNSKSSH